MSILRIGSKQIGDEQPTFIVAEIGINHNGFLRVAKHLIQQAKSAGADAVKFQKRKVETVYSSEDLAKPRSIPRGILENAIERDALPAESVRRLIATDFGATTNGDLKFALEFNADEYREIIQFCQNIGILCFSSPWDEDSVDFLDRHNPPVFKIASASLTDDDLLRHIKSKGKPIIISTGACSLDMIKYAVAIIKTNLAILHCTSCYIQSVTGSEEICEMVNLKAIETLRTAFPEIPIGFSSHFSGIMPAIEAVAMGASIIETHITLERGMWGSDQASSLEPQEFQELCKKIREMQTLKGDGIIQIYPQEIEVMKKLRRKTSPRQAELFQQHS